MRSLADRAVPVSEIFGARAATTATEVQNASTGEEKITAIDKLLIAGERTFPVAARAAAEAVETIPADPEITRVAHLAAATGVSVRALPRLFAEQAGSTPKWTIRIYRLHEAARVPSAERTPDYAGPAARLDYSGQPHFTVIFTR
ncbi:helix-turn-helix domain-containing protein [Amycolatopsis sulphurea]|uniref:helix-turn-helix domain-containing protein n=1 Tax=Amycolatopsis sulphurea TaxID=76022 RepID=UPI001FE470F8|nr:AraC family transcriptional regulator [Amycolatopsis sulphurea]